MKRTRLEDREYPRSTALDIVGERWKILILHDLFGGYIRFDQFQKNLGVSSGILTTRLKDSVDRGLIERRRCQTRPPRYEYVLSEEGRSLRPVIVALAAWGNSRLRPEERSMILVDAETGKEVEPVVVDAAGGRRLDNPEFVFTAGAAAGVVMRERYTGTSDDSAPAVRERRERVSGRHAAD